MAASPLLSLRPKRGQKGYLTVAFSGIPDAKSGEQNQKCCRTKEEIIRKAASPLPSRKPTRGGKCYVTLAFSGIPNKEEQSQNDLPPPCLLGGPKQGGNATSPLHSRGSPAPSKGSKIRMGFLTPTFSGAQKMAEMLRHPCILGDPQQRGTKSAWAASPLLSWAQKRAEMPHHPYIPGVQNVQRGEQNHKWSPTKKNKIRRNVLNASKEYRKP